MSISGFSMARNAQKLYYPLTEAVKSILSIVDEYVVAVGKGDADDNTLSNIQSIESNKIKIIETVWDTKAYPNGMENAHQTDIAKQACNGDWCFYLQADEVVHENDLQNIKNACKTNLKDKRVEGFLFNYLHFFGDYSHYITHHGWYQHEIRIVRNSAEIHSWQSAQSFRKIPAFDGKSYRQWDETERLFVKKIDARIFHYGWVRPPRLMQKKSKALDGIHKGEDKVEQFYSRKPKQFNYGPLGRLSVFEQTHPKVMREMISKFDWKDQLDYGKKIPTDRPLMKHELLKSRILSWIERNFLNGKSLFGYQNWKILQ